MDDLGFLLKDASTLDAVVDRTHAAPVEDRRAPERPDLPAEHPLAMETQSLDVWTARPPVPASSPAHMGLRRAGVILATLALSGAGLSAPYHLMARFGLTKLEITALGLFWLLFAWISFWFCVSLAGFFTLTGKRKTFLGVDPAAPLPEVSTRTAVLMPIYNEDAPAVFARVAAMMQSLAATRMGETFDVFVLSDSTDLNVARAERTAFEALRPQAALNLYYRRRPDNIERKAGNIGEWVRRFGGAYESMIVLDADSLMSGDLMVRLVDAMERHADVGCIQTIPVIINRATLFSRYQQFAVRLYSPIPAAGMAWVLGAESGYWGHNAILRVRAFAEAAGLPKLKGSKPFGGSILSHDLVESALMRRAGWAVHTAPPMPGSYEESPPTLVDFTRRDRRWCQGNLQHLQVAMGQGLHWISRLQLFVGCSAYLTSPLWLGFLLIGLGITLTNPVSLWEVLAYRHDYVALAATALVGLLTTLMLFGAKILSYLLVVRRRAERRAFGGAKVLAAGVALEILLSSLLAPVMMLTQTRALIEILLGRDEGWGVQRRDSDGLSLGEAFRRHGWQSVLGIGLMIALWGHAALFWPMSPILLGLALAVPLTVLSSRSDLGVAARREGLFRTPEEFRQPEIVRQAAEHARA